MQEFVGVFKEIPEFVARRTEGFCGELSSDLDAGYGRVFRNVANLIDLDARLAGERAFQLFGKRGRLGIATRKGADKSCELRLGESRREVNAGDPGTHQQLREAAFAGSGAERHTVQQDLGSRRAEQKAAAPAFV